ncbi:MAG: type II secretion system F family protein [Acidobacteria bacterium]|nr:type II secretion system F family protein [Acidobacteriota bacterium]
MAEYVCKVGNAQGQVFEQMEQADSETELRQRLSAQGLLIYSVRRSGLSALRLRLPGSRARLRADDFLIFNQQFATLIRAGLPILRSLDLLAERAARPALRAFLTDVRQRVRAGADLSQAFRAQGVFPEVYTASLLAGERSGNLTGVLDQYIAYQKVSGSVRRRLLTVLVYPALLVVFSSIVLGVVITYVVPRFAELYAELRAELPFLTQLVINFALHVRSSVLLILAAVVAGAAVAVPWSRTAGGGRVLDRVKLGLPVVGDIWLKFRVAQFARTLSTLLAGGIPLVTSLETARDSIGGPLLRDTVDRAAHRVREGQPLHRALVDPGLVPELMLEMVEVGEATGSLAQMLASVAEFYEEDLNTRLTALMALVEPLVLVFMGLVIAFILVALYLPVFSLATLVR